MTRVRSRNPYLRDLDEVNAVSKENVLLQLEHLKSHERVASRIQNGTLTLHGLWFDIQNTDVYYASEEKIFRIIDGVEGARILALLKGK